MKYDFKEITFLTFVRLDNEERIRNLQAMMGYYRKHCSGYTHIIVEDDATSKVPMHIDLTEDDVYVFTKSSTEWKKSEGYNKGIKLAKTNIINLIDTDIIIHPDQIIETAKALNNDSNAALIYPYNGLFLCAQKKLKDEFCKTLDYNTLQSRTPSQFSDYIGSRDKSIGTLKRYINGVYDDVLVGHVVSKGGCVMGRRDNLIKCNGYNPKFIGWGYEDDEMPARANILGFTVGRIEGTGKVLWHLHHYDGTGSAKETQPFYEHNRQTVSEVEHGDKDFLVDYIKTWRL